MTLDRIEEAVEDIREGRFIVIVDDEDRENEGDLAIAADRITPEAVNFMATHGRGLICVASESWRLDELGLPAIVRDFGMRSRGLVLFVGPTGSGKSTIIGLMPRFYDPTAGRILIDGVDIRDYRLHGLRRQRRAGHSSVLIDGSVEPRVLPDFHE